MDKLEIKRALLYNKPSILYRTVGPVETNVFPNQIDFYRICPSDRHVWESLVTFDTQARRSSHLRYFRSLGPILRVRTVGLVAKFEDCTSPSTGFELTTLVVMDTDYTGSCKFNYHTITTMTAPSIYW